MPPSRTLLALWALALAAPALAEEPALFVVKVEAHRVDEGSAVVPPGAPRPELVGTTASLKEEITLELTYQAGPGFQPLKSSASSRYAWRRSLVHATNSSTVREEKGEEAGSELLDWDVTIERDFRPIACEDLIVHDQVGDGRESRSGGSATEAPSEVRLRFRAAWPGRVRLRDASAGVLPFDSETLPTLELSRPFHYELEGSEAARRVSTLGPSPAAEDVAGATTQTSVELTLAPIAPHEFGLTARVASDGTPALLSRVVVGGRDVTSSLRVRRMERSWVVKREPGGAETYELASDWRAFTNEGGLPIPREQLQEAIEAPGGKDRRWLVEFLEMVEDLPELGLLYHTVAMETRAEGPRFHLLASEGRSISPSAWCEIRGRSSPGMDGPSIASRGPLKVIAEASYGNSGIANR